VKNLREVNNVIKKEKNIKEEKCGRLQWLLTVEPTVQDGCSV
jgi:hypothetical protein